MNLIPHLAKVRATTNVALWNTWKLERNIHTSQRSLKQVLTRAMRIKGEEYYRRMDGIPKDYEMIYKFPMHYTLNMGKLAVFTSNLSLSGFCLYNYITDVPLRESEFVSNLAANMDDFWWFVGAIAYTSLLVYRCCHIITLRIYRNEKSFIAMMPGIVPRFDKKVHFQKGEVKEHFGALSFFRGVTYKINNKNVVIIPDRFRRPTDLFEMLQNSDAAKYKKIK